MRSTTIVALSLIVAVLVVTRIASTFAEPAAAQTTLPAAQIRVNFVPDPRNLVWSSTDLPPYSVPEGRRLVITDVVNASTGSTPDVLISADGDVAHPRFEFKGAIPVSLASGIPFEAGETVTVSSGTQIRVIWYGYLN